MTGEKNRFKTVEKLWDLDDKQLKTPKHDEMILWLLDKDNIKKLGLDQPIFEDAFYVRFMINKKHYDKSWGSPTHLSNYVGGKLEEFLINKLTPKVPQLLDKFKPETKLEIKSEVPLKGHNGFINGYVDIMLIFDFPSKKEFSDCIYLDSDGNDCFEDNEYAKYRVYVEVRPKRYNHEKNICERHIIEVKPFIDSFGAVLRQINSYRSFLGQEGYNHYYLLTEDFQYKGAFESQGIKLLTIPKED